MAIIFMDGFDLNDYALRWKPANVSTTTSTRFGTGRALSLVTGYGDYATRSFGALNTFYTGFAIKFTTAAVAHGFITVLGDSGAIEHLTVKFISSTLAGVYRGGTLLGSFPIQISVWFYFEMSAVINDLSGSVAVRIDGTEVLSLNDVDTKNGGTNNTIDQMRFGRSGTLDTTSGQPYIDDLYVSDSGFLGDVRVHTLVPTADTATADLTPTGSSSHFANVSEIPDSAATYNSSATVGHKDLYTMADLPASVSAIHAVQANNHAWKTDAGSKNLKNVIKSGATTAYGASVGLSASMTANSDVFAVDPATSTAWTASGVNGVEVGVEVA